MAASPSPLSAEPRSATPPVAPVVHRLPFPAGQSYVVFQGNNQRPSHFDEWNRYAFDFSPMPVGSDVCASADGVVTFVKEDTEGPTAEAKDNNEVAIQHADGTVSIYDHLEKDGALVDVGQRVFAGDPVARSGNTGKSDGPHLHFCLKSATRLGAAIPCRFEDVPDGGVPVKGDTVTSNNVTARDMRGAFDRLERLYDLAARGDWRECVAPSLAALQRPKPPPDFAAILARYGERADALGAYNERREKLIARYRGDAEAALAAVAAAREAGDVRGATAAATLGAGDFAPLDLLAKFQSVIAELRKDAGYASAALSVSATQSWRRELTRALDLESKTEAKASAGKKADWPIVLKTYDSLVSRAPSTPAREALTAYVESVRDRVRTPR